jgi:ankyrin repeat protein
VAQGVDIEARDRLQDTALTFAAKNGALECMKLLVSRGANTSARDAEGYTVLLASLSNGHTPLVKYLLTTGNTAAPHTHYTRYAHARAHDTHPPTHHAILLV